MRTTTSATARVPCSSTWSAARWARRGRRGYAASPRPTWARSCDGQTGPVRMRRSSVRALGLASPPWLEQPGLPSYEIVQAVERAAAEDGGSRTVDVTVQELGTGARFGGRISVVVSGIGDKGKPWELTQEVNVAEAPTTVRFTTPGKTQRVQLDPMFHVARRIEDAAIPPCLNRTLKAEGQGLICLRGPGHPALQALAKRLGQSTGWPVSSDRVETSTHQGPVVTLEIREAGPLPALADVPPLTTPSQARVHSTRTPGGPRTHYIARSAAAAARAGYLPFYGWDTTVVFDNGIPVARKVQRPASPATDQHMREPPAGARAGHPRGVGRHAADCGHEARDAGAQGRDAARPGGRALYLPVVLVEPASRPAIHGWRTSGRRLRRHPRRMLQPPPGQGRLVATRNRREPGADRAVDRGQSTGPVSRCQATPGPRCFGAGLRRRRRRSRLPRVPDGYRRTLDAIDAGGASSARA